MALCGVKVPPDGLDDQCLRVVGAYHASCANQLDQWLA